ncbi:MAG: serine hydrolase family protein [Chitinophagaceae bacterium]|nr:MAG: serine hydrolase family protein [Chitinophagaceae bacterium]
METNNPKILFLHSAGPQHEEEGSARLLQSLRQSLSGEFDIIAPLLPHPDNPDYESWKNAIAGLLQVMDEGMIIIGHSFGGSVLLKYLSEHSFAKPIAAIFLVAVPFWGHDEEWEVPDFHLVPRFADRLPPVPVITVFHSKDDNVIPVTHAARYAAEIPDATLQLSDGHGHAFWDGLPELVSAVRDLQR